MHFIPTTKKASIASASTPPHGCPNGLIQPPQTRRQKNGKGGPPGRKFPQRKRWAKMKQNRMKNGNRNIMLTRLMIGAL